MVRTNLLAAVLLFSVMSRGDATAQSDLGQKLQFQLQEANNIYTRVAGDLRPEVTKMRTQNKLVQGKNLVLATKAQGKTPAFKLWATVEAGKVTKWQAADAGGKNLTTKTHSVVQSATTACVVCITLADGHDHCYQIDCKDLPKPKPKTGAAIR